MTLKEQAAFSGGLLLFGLSVGSYVALLFLVLLLFERYLLCCRAGSNK